MSGRLVKVRAVRTADGKPSMLPRVADPAHALAAPGWTVYTEPGLLPRAARFLARLCVRGVVALGVLTARCLVAVIASGGPAAAGPLLRRCAGCGLRRCAGCGLRLHRRDGVGLVDVRTGSPACPVIGVPHAARAVTGRG